MTDRLVDPKFSNQVSAGWQGLSAEAFLGNAARSLGVITATESGWTPASAGAVPPISMAGGLPDPATIPTRDLMAAFQNVLERSASSALSYGGGLGFEGLRALLAGQSQEENGLAQGPENYVLTNGSSAAIDLLCRTILNPGDVVVAESPSFSGSLRTIRGHQVLLKAVSVDRQGLLPDELEDLLARLAAAGTPARMLYTVPDFHNPTGTTLELQRRLRVIEIAARNQMLILEDAAYADLFFDGERSPSLYALASGMGVLRAGTFSKTIATGLRVGWLQGRSDFISACSQMRFDMGGSPLVQRALAEYLSSSSWHDHLAAMRKLYARKCTVLCDALIAECEAYARFTRPDGGFFLWLQCLGGFSARAVVQAAAAEGLISVQGGGFFVEQGDDRHIRLAYSAAPLDELPEAAARLRRAFERVAETSELNR